MTKITIDRAVVEQALEALEAFLSDELRPYEAAKTAAALKAALAEPQEPVAWAWETSHELAPQDAFSWVQTAIHKMPLYAATPQRPAEPVQEPNRAQKMRDAGYTRRPTLREMAEPVQEPTPMPPFPPVSLWKRGCAVCGIGAGGHAYGYVCPRSDCPTRVTCGGTV